MKHLVFADHEVSLEQILLDRDVQEELVQVELFQELIDYPFPINGLILLVLNSTEGWDFAALKNKYLVQKVVILSDSLSEELLLPIMRDHNWVDLFYPIPVSFTELLGMHKVITGIHDRSELDLTDTSYFNLNEQKVDLEIKDVPAADLAIAPQEDYSQDLESADSTVTTTSTTHISQHQDLVSDNMFQQQANTRWENSEAGPSMPNMLAAKDEQLYKSLAHNQLLRQKIQNLEKRTDQLEMEAHYWQKKVEEMRQESEEISLNAKLLENNFYKEREEAKQKVQILEEKQRYWEQKYHEQKLKTGELSSKQHMDHKSIKRREEELEERLSLLQSDSGLQIQSREKKIMEYKRKLDLMDFDLQESILREREMKERIKDLERKLENSVSTLRTLFHDLELTSNSGLAQISVLKKVD